MNSTVQLFNLQERYADAFAKNFTIVFLAVIIISINGVFVYIFFRSSIFYNDPRYILYIHLVINDMLMVCLSVTLFVMSFAWQNVPFPFCATLLIITSTAHKNTPLTLAGMAVERYIAICKPLHHHQICTVHRTYILISLIWGVGVLPGLNDLIVIVIVRPLSVFKTVALCSSATLYNTPYHEELSKFTLGLYTSVVWVILVFTYCQVLIAARRASTDKSSAKKGPKHHPVTWSTASALYVILHYSCVRQNLSSTCDWSAEENQFFQLPSNKHCAAIAHPLDLWCSG